MSGEQLFATRHMCEGLARSYLSDLTISRRQLKEKLPRTKDRDHLRRCLEYRGQRKEHRGRSLEYRGQRIEHPGRSLEYLGQRIEYRGRTLEHRGRTLEQRGTNNHTEGEIRALWTETEEGLRPEEDIHSKDDGSFSQRGI
jgi:hypothetical protein